MNERNLYPQDLENILFRLKVAEEIRGIIGQPDPNDRISLGSDCRLNYSPTPFARSGILVSPEELRELEELIEDSRELVHRNRLGLMENPGLLMNLGLLKGKRRFFENMADLSWAIQPPFRASMDFCELSDLDLINEGHPILGYRLTMTVDPQDGKVWTNILFSSDGYFALTLDYGRHYYCSGVLPLEEMTDEEGRIIAHYLQEFNQLVSQVSR